MTMKTTKRTAERTFISNALPAEMLDAGPDCEWVGCPAKATRMAYTKHSAKERNQVHVYVDMMGCVCAHHSFQLNVLSLCMQQNRDLN